ncbi:MAG: hypothetical protein KDD63_26850, partial [Bacteroidetes bacterium]|nr:hypothetical protein [Bacteroidota bacterium]
ISRKSNLKEDMGNRFLKRRERGKASQKCQTHIKNLLDLPGFRKSGRSNETTLKPISWQINH